MNIYKLNKTLHNKINVKSFSQFGEDLLLLQIFKNQKNGVCVDVGANDGDYGSNSALLESRGWLSILIEPNAALCQQILATRKPYKLFECAASSKESEVTLYLVNGGALAHGLSTLEPNQENMQRIKNNHFSYQQTQVRSKTLDSLLSDSNISKVDVISIDVEGHELEVLKGLTFEKWKPRIFIIEDNSIFKSNEISAYMNKKQYQAFFRTGVNDWYAHIADKELINFSNSFNYQLSKLYQIGKSKLMQYKAIKKIVHILRN